MRIPVPLTALVLLSLAGRAGAETQMVTNVVNDYIIPGYEALSAATEGLKEAAAEDCTVTSEPLLAAYHGAFDAWIAVSHLRFGPSEEDNRAFALAFWPDSRGATPQTLSRLIADQDPGAVSAEEIGEVSIAARGFYGLEFLLYDPALSVAGDPAYHCALVQTLAADIDANADAILGGWQDGYSDLMINPGPDSPYQSNEETVRELYRALSTGLEFDADARLGRPLGTFERPRPTRAEAWRSGRSLRNVLVSLASLRQMAELMADGDEELEADLDAVFARSLALTDPADDPVFAGVATPSGRLRVEVFQQSISRIRDTVSGTLGPALGVDAGFNSLDGD